MICQLPPYAACSLIPFVSQSASRVRCFPCILAPLLETVEGICTQAIPTPPDSKPSKRGGNCRAPTALLYMSALLGDSARPSRRLTELTR